MVAAFLFISAAAHWLVASPGIYGWYLGNLDRGRNYARWIEYSLSASLMMVLIAMLGRIYFFGGRGTILGTFLASWLLVIVSTGMTVANLLPAIQLTVLGILLIVAIIATNMIYARTQR